MIGPQTPPIDEVADTPQDTAQEPANPPPPRLPSELADFLAQQNIEEGASFNCRLYRFDKGDKGRPRRVTCDEYDNTIPTLKEIGTTYGSGEYELVASWYQGIDRPRGIQVCHFHLDRRWDRIRDDALIAPRAPQHETSLPFVFGMVRELIASVAPLLSRPAPPPEGASVTGTANVLETLNGTMSRLLESNFANQLSMQGKMMEVMSANIAPEAEDKPDSAIDKIVEVLHTVIPLFSAMPAAAAQPMANAVRDRPEVRSVLASATRQAVLYHKIRREFDPSTADKVCQLFGVKPPANAQQRPAPIVATPPAPPQSAKGKNGKAKK